MGATAAIPRKRFVISATLLLCIAGRSYAESEDAKISTRSSLEWINAATVATAATSSVNPQNLVLELPDLQLISDLRPNIRLEWGPVALIMRPRFAGSFTAAAPGNDCCSTHGDFSAEFIELFIQWNALEWLTLAYGVQNFQWGPAETLSPSNRLVHETGFATTALTVIRGKHLARVNFSIGQSISIVITAELFPSEGPDFIAGEDFARKFQGKFEYASPDGRWYVGATGGAGISVRPWFGEYGSWEFLDGLSLYADLSHSLGSRAWYPALEPTGQGFFARDRETEGRIYTLAVIGMRYVFESGTDLRLEVVHNDAGWSPDELAKATAVASRSLLLGPAALGPYYAPGFELPGQDYLYLSARWPDLGPEKRFSVHARWLLSFRDGSGVAVLAAEWAVLDSLVILGTGSIFHGGRDAELTRAARASLLLGAKATW